MNLYADAVLKLTTEYVGPSAKAFLERQTRSHMGGLEFGNIDRSNAADLARWVNVSAGLLIGKEKAKELSERILKV